MAAVAPRESFPVGRSLSALSAVAQAQYYEQNYKEAGDYLDTASTVSAGSNGSGSGSALAKIELMGSTASTVYFA